MPKTGESGSRRGRRMWSSSLIELNTAERARHFDTLWYGNEEAERRRKARSSAVRTKVGDDELRNLTDIIRKRTGKRRIYNTRKRTRG